MANVQAINIVSAIHKKVREETASYQLPEVMEDWSNDLARLQSAYNATYCARNLVGSVPQLPNTFTGMVAGWLVGIAQRLLFWYTPQVRYFNEASANTLNRICGLEERNFRVFLAMRERLEKVEQELRLLKAAPGTNAAPAGQSAESGAQETPAAPAAFGDSFYTREPIDERGFYFELQGRFQSSEPDDISRLEMYRSVIANLDPRIPDAPWLDVGCGRGKWLRIGSDAGYRVAGVDSNPASIAQCREAGFEVTQSDALDFLRTVDDRTFAVVSAFHVLEHVPFSYCLNLVFQIARTLKPGGVLLIETPHPANLLMAAEQFWLDPTHQRPIPLPLMEFLFEYCGLSLAHRFEINPRAEAEHLPFREVELVNRLDLLLFGPQDYAIFGRRRHP
jgi:SAM-dependent methyltransferase